MDVLLIKGQAFELPTSHRVGAIVHDGAVDLRLWPGPGVDRDLSYAWGPGLKEALDAQRPSLEGQEPMLAVTRIHPGRLHCDFLAWVGTRPPEHGTERAPAPDAARLAAAVEAVLNFVSERAVVRVAFPVLGEGPGALPRLDRIALLVEAARRWEDRRFAEGRPQVVEEVLVCEPESGLFALARRRVASLAKAGVAEPPRPMDEPPPAPKRAARRPASGGTSRAPSARGRKRLDPAEIDRARLGAPPYDRARAYAAGDWLVHPKFGVGRIEAVDVAGAVTILFEDGSEKRLVAARPA